MKKILITGINSYIGNSFEQWVKDHNPDFTVEKLSLREPEWHFYDFSGVDVIFHVAGLAHADVGKISDRQQKEYYRVNTDLTIELAQIAKEAGVKQFIYMSSIIVYGDSAPMGKRRVITDKTPMNPAGFYGDSKKKAEEGLVRLTGCQEGVFAWAAKAQERMEARRLQAESLQAEGTAEENFRLVILRPPMIYGPNSKGNYPLLEKAAKKIPVFPKVKNQRSMLYVESLCKLVSLLIQNEEEGVFFPQNKSYVSTCHMVDEIAKANGKSIWFTGIGNPMLRLLSKTRTGLGQTINKVFGNLVYDHAISEYREPYRVAGLRKSIYRIQKAEGEGQKGLAPEEVGQQPTTTVVTVCYNSEKGIGKTIRSILKQTVPPSQYIVIDGASSDRTVSIVESYREMFEERGTKLLVVSEPDGGIYDAMNKGIRLAESDLLGFLNAGDWYEPDMIGRTVRTFMGTDCDISYGNIRIVREKKTQDTSGVWDVVVKKAKVRPIYQTSRDWNHPTMFVRTVLAKQNPFLDKGIHDDYAFYLKLKKAGAKIVTIDGELANFRMGGASNRKSLKASLKRIHDRYLYCYRSNGYSPLYLLECVFIEAVKFFI